ncbi:hypothetical protein L9F63_005075 [Diploptera punctata]|uniref:Transmembrane protein 186 n=1 Tax=Diploptera punctata TaxID=6984 RepID=A0AAD8E646_DIPPU|nr:hypothetical protein L9F63_005075 [Diploptera punctata]
MQDTDGLVSEFASKEYNMFYKLPYIKSASLVNKLKKVYTSVVVAGAPVTLGLWAADIISAGTFNAFCCLGSMLCISLYTLGILFYKLIGFVYLSTDNTIVKVSYLDFWGRRVDSYCPIGDIMPLSDMQENPSDIFIKFVQYSSPQILYLTLRFGCIKDMELFVKVFGKINL